MHWLEIIGLLLVFCASCLFGVTKSIGLKLRARRIYSLVRSCETLAEYIRLGQGEILPLIEKCFDKDLITVGKIKFYVNQEAVGEETAQILEEFLRSAGMKDKKAEYERALFYKKMLEKQYTDALKVSDEQGRLYNTLGVLCGLFLILFLV